MSTICQNCRGELAQPIPNFCPRCGHQLGQTEEPKVFVSMPAGDYAALYGAGKTADFFLRFGWIKAFALIIGPIFGANEVYGFVLLWCRYIRGMENTLSILRI